MPDTSKNFTIAEKAILRNQRLILLALNILIVNLAKQGWGNQRTSTALRERILEMDRNWEFISDPNQRLVPYEPD